MIYGDAGDRNLSRLLLRLSRARGAAGACRRRLPAPAGARGRRGRRGAGRAGAPRGGRRAVQRGRAGAAPVRRAARHLRAGGRQPDPVPPRAAPAPGAGWPAATSGSAAIPGSGPSSSRGSARTRRSPSTTRPATWATRRARSPTASPTRPGCSGWSRDPRGPRPARPHGAAAAARPGGAPGPAARPAGRPARASPPRPAWPCPARTRPPRSAGRTGSGRSTRSPPARWPGLPELQAGKIGLLGQIREIGDASGWQHAEAPRLWRFHLYYWDWAWGLAADPDRLAARATFARLWRSWQAWDRFGRGDAWHPYPAALRAWSWCGLHRELVAGSDIEPAFIAGARCPRRFPAPPPGVRRRRQPPDQGAQGGGRPGRLLRRRAAAAPRGPAADQPAGPAGAEPTAVTTSARPPITARSWPTSSTWRACSRRPGSPRRRS